MKWRKIRSCFSCFMCRCVLATASKSLHLTEKMGKNLSKTESRIRNVCILLHFFSRKKPEVEQFLNRIGDTGADRVCVNLIIDWPDCFSGIIDSISSRKSGKLVEDKCVSRGQTGNISGSSLSLSTCTESMKVGLWAHLNLLSRAKDL